MTRLILWRHGRTEWNAIGRIQGQSDVALDETGLIQAAQAAPRIAALKPDVIVSSDLRRTADTAAAAAVVTGLPIEYDARLRERDFGPWQGLNRDEIQARYPADFARWWTTEPFEDQRIETVDDMMKRVGDALREIAARLGDNGTALVVTHGGAAKAGTAGLLGWPTALVESLSGLGNCRYSDLRHTPQRGWQLRAHNL